MIAGKFIGEYALGAISATGSFDSLFQSLFNGFGGGLAIYVAYLFGMGDYSTLKRDVIHILMIVAALCVMLSSLAILFRNPIMDYLNVDPILRKDAEIYFIIHTSAYAFSFCNLIMINILRSLGITFFSVYVPLGSALLNISENLLTMLPVYFLSAIAAWSAVDQGRYTGLYCFSLVAFYINIFTSIHLLSVKFYFLSL